MCVYWSIKKLREFSGVWPKVTQSREDPNELLKNYQLNLINGLSANARKRLDQPEARRQ